MRIYFDNAATTPLAPEALEAMLPYYTKHFGNPSSIHADGRVAKTAVEDARKIVARHLNASIGEVYFTSGGTESNNMALRGAVRDLGVERIISSKIEHHCVLHAVNSLSKSEVAEIEFVSVLEDGHVDLTALEQLLQSSSKKTMVSLMHTNNEIGNILDLTAVSELCEAHGAFFHSDTVQSVGYLPIDVDQLNISFLSGSAHKFHGPKGVGFLYINSNNIIHNMLDGGAQERNMRPGTENVAGVVGLAKAFDLSCLNREERITHIKSLKSYLINQLQSNFEDFKFNGDYNGLSHPKILSVSFKNNFKTEMMVFSLDIAGISCSGGSACSSGVESGSHVLATLFPDDKRKTVRFSFAHTNTKEEVDILVSELAKILKPEISAA